MAVPADLDKQILDSQAADREGIRCRCASHSSGAAACVVHAPFDQVSAPVGHPGWWRHRAIALSIGLEISAATRDPLRALLVKFCDESSPMNGEGNGLECAWHGGPCKDGRNPNGDEACTACKIRAVIGETPA